MKQKSYIGAGLVLGLILATVLFFNRTTVPNDVYAITSESIREKQEELNQAKEEIDSLKKSLSDVERMVKELEGLKGDLAQYVRALDESLATIIENIERLEQEIEVKEEEIFDMELQLENALLVEEQQYEAMIRRIRFMYESGDLYFLEFLLNAQSFTEMLNKADYAEKVMEYDRNLLADYKRIREFVELCKQQLELEKEYLDEQKLAVDQERQSLEEMIQSKNQEIARYESDISNKEQAIREFKAEIEAQDAMINTLEQQIADEKRRLLESNRTVIRYDGGMFKFPLATYTRISDDYGTRIHPILGIEHFHNGVDFAAPAGTAIYAAYDGIVVAAEYNGTMGNYVMIDHGDSLFTIYMHASALYVNKGDIVIKGETIAAVGTTGRSTGNHLHFTVRLNGAYVSPWNYLSP